MRYTRTLLLLSVLTAAPASMFGQTAAGTLTGIVTDPSGAVLSGVSVTATHVDTGTKIIGTTSQTGNYTIPQMPVGRYLITVGQTGFKNFRQENVIIAATQTLRLDISMEVGANTESVTVTAESTLIQADSGAIVHNIISDQIQNLPVLRKYDLYSGPAPNGDDASRFGVQRPPRDRRPHERPAHRHL